MSRWERGAKITVKCIAWSVVYLAAALSLGLEPSWRLVLFAVICEIASKLFDRMISTET